MRRLDLVVLFLGSLAGVSGSAASDSPALFFEETFNHGILSDTWKLKGEKDLEEQNRFDVIQESGNWVLRVKSQSASSGLAIERPFLVAEYPFLSWRWKVDDLPRGADLKIAGKDDYAARIIVYFRKASEYQRQPYSLSYVWSNLYKKEEVFASRDHPGYDKIVVLQSGKDNLGRWQGERRNLWADFEKAFGGIPTEVEAVMILANTKNTRSKVTCYIDDLTISGR